MTAREDGVGGKSARRSRDGWGQPPAKIAQAGCAARHYNRLVLTSDDRRTIRFWRPDTDAVTGMLRVENEDRAKITYAEHFTVVAVYEGAFDGWYRGGVRTHVAGSLKLKEPGEVHRDLRVHAPPSAFPAHRRRHARRLRAKLRLRTNPPTSPKARRPARHIFDA